MKLPIIRLMTGLFLVLSAIVAGAMARSAWVILPLTLIFTITFIQGRWRSWKSSLEKDSLSRVLSQLLATLAVQTILVMLLYLIGRGAGAVLGTTTSTVLSFWDFLYSLIVAFVSIMLGSIVIWRERNASRLSQQLVASNEEISSHKTYEIKLLPEVVTLQNFFHGIHYSHATYDGPERVYNGTPNANSAGSDEKIASAEARLGIILPEGLKALYRVQNGGSVDMLCAVKDKVIEPHYYEDLVLPFGGYDDLYPTETIRTMFDSVTDYADADDVDQADSFPVGCKKMFILAQWYRHTLFLDYNIEGSPRVGFVDFDDYENWQTHCVWWNDFDTFFSALRRYDSA